MFNGEKIPFFEKEKQFGCNVSIRNFYFRHAEKASGLVGDENGMSISRLSEKGRHDSYKLGSQIGNPAKDGFKIKWSGLERTLETGEEKTEGYLGDNDRKKFITREVKELSGDLMDTKKEFGALYIEKWEMNKKAILEKRDLKIDSYTILDSTQQAEIAEEAEEPVIAEWIDDPKSDLHKFYPPEEAAAYIATIVNKGIEMVKKLKNNSAVDIFNMTHKTITEPLLMKIILLPNGQKPQKLAEIGGALGLNEGWELDVKTDNNGTQIVKLIMYRVNSSNGQNPKYDKTEYNIDLDELNRLAEIGKELRKNDE